MVKAITWLRVLPSAAGGPDNVYLLSVSEGQEDCKILSSLSFTPSDDPLALRARIAELSGPPAELSGPPADSRAIRATRKIPKSSWSLPLGALPE